MGPAPKVVQRIGAPAGARTQDPKIKSLVLYRLSYRRAPLLWEARAPHVKTSPGHGPGPGRYQAAPAGRIFTMRSGFCTWPLLPAPRLILSTNSMPEVTRPQIVYWPSRLG